MPGSPRLAAARQAIHAGDIDGALAAYRKVTDSADLSASELLECFEAFWASFQFEEAINLFGKASALHRQSFLVLAAKRLFSIGRFSQAEQFLREALNQNPADP